MPTSISHWEIDADLTLAGPDASPLLAHALELALYREGGALVETRLTMAFSGDDYERIDREELFHLEPLMRGPGGDTFAPDGTFEVEARLDASLLAGVAALGEDILQAGPAFAALSPGSPLLETESWWALSVTTEIMRDAEGGSLREGYATLHDSTGHDLRLPMLAIAAGAFEDRNLDWHETADDEVIRADIAGENGSWTCYVVARETESRCTIYSQAPWATPDELRHEMAELITRINFGLPIGNFEMDYSDGEVRFKTSIDLSNTHLSTELLDGLLEPNLSIMDIYLPALEAVRDARMTPAQAVEMVES